MGFYPTPLDRYKAMAAAERLMNYCIQERENEILEINKKFAPRRVQYELDRIKGRNGLFWFMYQETAYTQEQIEEYLNKEFMKYQYGMYFARNHLCKYQDRVEEFLNFTRTSRDALVYVPESLVFDLMKFVEK